MKLVVAVVHAEDAAGCGSALVGAGFVCTRLDSAGGFLSKGNALLLSGVEDHRVDEAMAVIAATCRKRTEMLGQPVLADAATSFIAAPVEVDHGGATVFVLQVDRFEQL